MKKRTQQRKSNQHTPYAPLYEAVRQATYDYMTTHNNGVPSTETPAIKALMKREYRRQVEKSTGLFKTQPSWERIEGWTNSAIADGVRWHDSDERKDQRDADILKQRQQQEQQYQQYQQEQQYQQAQHYQQHQTARHQQRAATASTGGSFGLGGI